MKRETKQRGATVWTFPGSPVEYVLNLDYRKAATTMARQRAEIRRKDKALRMIAKGACSTFDGCVFDAAEAEIQRCDGCRAAAALKPLKKGKS